MEELKKLTFADLSALAMICYENSVSYMFGMEERAMWTVRHHQVQVELKERIEKIFN